jgi:hypothetical protein
VIRYREAVTLGEESKDDCNPNGVVANAGNTTLFRVGTQINPGPRVAAQTRQPWAVIHNRFAVRFFNELSLAKSF